MASISRTWNDLWLPYLPIYNHSFTAADTREMGDMLAFFKIQSSLPRHIELLFPYSSYIVPFCFSLGFSVE